MIMKFNERLKELREKSKLTQEQLAKISGVSSRMIQRYEYGTSRPRLDAAEKQLTEEVTGLFAGGEMAQEDMDVMMKAIQDAYWIAKEKNKKYTPKKYRSE